MINVSKHNDEESNIVTHSLVLVEGTVSNKLVEYIEVDNQTTGTSINWPIVERKFKILVFLKPGANRISLRHAFYLKKLHYTLRYNPKQSDCIVQPLYIITDDCASFQSPPGVDNSQNAANKRISLGLALLQLFTAEMLQSLALGPATFQLPLDTHSGIPRCSVFCSKYSSKELHNMADRELWRSIARELMESNLPNRYTSKFVAFLACTRYDGGAYESSWRHCDVLSATKGHVALGGGGLALLGSGTLHTWADNLNDLVKCFTDNSLIDKFKLMDDSAYRSTYWANYATGLGATLHELGHTFDLPHTQTGIMSRGFDNIHKFFILQDAKPVPQQLNCESAKLQALKKQLNGMSEQKRNVKCDNSSNSFTLPVVKNISVETRSGDCLSPSSPAGVLEHARQSKSSPLSPSPPLPSDALTLTFPHLDELAVTESASCWSLESAAMLRYSRWLMQDSDITRSKGHVTKPAITSQGQIHAPHGLKVLQVFRQCLDRTVHSLLLDNQEQTITVDVADVRVKVTNEHRDECNRQTCDVLHLRDGLGNFYSLSL